jgi:phytoene dehydrogenase-like protein
VHPVVIVGGGLSGLSAARRLQAAGVEWQLFEAGERIGGKVKTDIVDGFRLDRGFQVHFSAYPATAALVDPASLGLGTFRRGARIWDGERVMTIDADNPIATVFSRTFGLTDKWKSWRWFHQLRTVDIQPALGLATRDWLRDLGFSERWMEMFGRPFLAGISLDPSLALSARQIAFILSALNRGDVGLPREGIEALPKAMARPLPVERIRCDARVEAVTDDGVRVQGDCVPAAAVIVATDTPEASALLGLKLPLAARSSTVFYFSTSAKAEDEPFLRLNAAPGGFVNHVAPVAVAQPSYGSGLFSATVLGVPAEGSETVRAVAQEVAAMFGRTEGEFDFVRRYTVERAQLAEAERVPVELGGVYLAGEAVGGASIEGAVVSGQRAADAVLARLGVPA